MLYVYIRKNFVILKLCLILNGCSCKSYEIKPTENKQEQQFYQTCYILRFLSPCKINMLKDI